VTNDTAVASGVPTEAIWRAVPVVTCILLGQALLVAIVVGPAYSFPFAAAAVICCYALIIRRWRLGVYGLILYIPFAGVPTILLYPAPGIVTQSKDLLFVIPTYVGFFLWLISRRTKLFLSREMPLLLFAAFTAIVVLQLLNPLLVNPLVGLIGLKVRLFYIPFFFLGYCFVDSRQRLLDLAKIMVAAGILPVVIGVVQAVLVYSGRPELAYGWYGAAAEAVTQGYARIGVDVGMARVPSTFTFVTQYWSFLLGLLPMSYAMFIASGRVKYVSRRLSLVALSAILLAAVTSGARAAYALLPLFFFVAAMLEFRWERFWKPMVLFIGGLALAAVIMGVPLDRLVAYQNTVVGSYASTEGLLGELQTASARTWVGWGTGMSTGPARYAFAADQDTGLGGLEGYYAAILLELGLVGLVIVVALLSRLLLAGYRSFVRLRDPVLRPFGTSILALLCVLVVYLVKGAFIDYDPLNVYFWMYAGILIKLPVLQRTA
jgi:hypothetical protein